MLKKDLMFFKKNLRKFQQTLDFFLLPLFLTNLRILFRRNDLSKFLQHLFHEIWHNSWGTTLLIYSKKNTANLWLKLVVF